jgi:hypothetical protein
VTWTKDRDRPFHFGEASKVPGPINPVKSRPFHEHQVSKSTCGNLAGKQWEDLSEHMDLTLPFLTQDLKMHCDSCPLYYKVYVGNLGTMATGLNLIGFWLSWTILKCVGC